MTQSSQMIVQYTCTYPESSGSHGTFVSSTGVLVDRNLTQLQNSLNSSTIRSLGFQIHQHKMIIGTPWKISQLCSEKVLKNIRLFAYPIKQY